MSDVQLARRSERREREHAHARAAILAAASSVAARDGADALTLRGVAQEAGYAPAALYGYFKGRSDLVLALAAEDLAALARSLRATNGQTDFASAARTVLAQLGASRALADAVAALASRDAGAESERLLNGRMIAALRALSVAIGRPSDDRAAQRDTLVIAATLTGLALFSRSARLDALGFSQDELVDHLELRFANS